MDYQQCKTCKEDKPLTVESFERRTDVGVTRWRKVCKVCVGKNKHLYHTANQEKRSNRAKERYRQDGGESKRSYYLQNYKDIAKKKLERERCKYKPDPVYRMRRNIRRLVGMYLLKQGGKKNGLSFLSHIDYTMEELRTHLEKQFEPWMNWNNYGSYKLGGERRWNIDHIIPQSHLPYDSMNHPNFQKCWALSNLRPLDSIANSSRGNRV